MLKRLKIHPFWFSAYCMVAGFLTYCSMYAFRKPFTAATYDGITLLGLNYKILLITAQIIGYALSKFIGIKIVSEIKPRGRIVAIATLICVSWIALLGFAIFPAQTGVFWLFLNGLPLGMIWGLVFSFMEGRRNTEMIGAAMSVSFIVSSGFVKAVGKTLLAAGVGEFWMPFYTGLVFVPVLVLGVWMLHKIPPPDDLDIESRTQRIPMLKNERKAFFNYFSGGIIAVVVIYAILTIFRDVRDNFAVEIWSRLGYKGNAQILATAELPIGLAIFIIAGMMVFIKSNQFAFYFNLGMVMLSGILLILITYLFTVHIISPVAWMIGFGFSTYLAYVTFHTLLFERWIALFKYKSNIGFLLYIADAFGYLGSVGILIFKNFTHNTLNWLDFIKELVVTGGSLMIVLSLFAFGYFIKKQSTAT